jgi:hypothetical protein
MAPPRVAVSGNVLPFKRAASAPDAAAAAACAAAGATPAAASSPWAAVQSVQSPAQSPAPAKSPGSPSRAIPSLGPRPAFLQVGCTKVDDSPTGIMARVVLVPLQQSCCRCVDVCIDHGVRHGSGCQGGLAALFQPHAATHTQRRTRKTQCSHPSLLVPVQSSARAVSGDYSGPQIGFDVALPAAVDEGLPAGSPADESAEERADRFAAQRSLLDRAFSRCGSLLRPTLCWSRSRGCAYAVSIAHPGMNARHRLSDVSPCH